MNLDFLLSPDKDNNNENNNSDNRGGRNSGQAAQPESSPLSLDYIAPRTSEASNRPPSSSRQLSRRLGESGSTHLRPQQLPQVGSSPSSRGGSSRDQQASSRSYQRGRRGKASGSPSTLRNLASGDVKPHVCPACDRSFYKLEQLKRHDRLVHQNLRPFVCTTCDLSFGTKQNMQVHLTTRKHQHRLETLQASHRSSHGSSSRQHP